ncbi:hypothetical protein U1Q18_023418 [Sarracenia purpurea var. burkii]
MPHRAHPWAVTRQSSGGITPIEVLLVLLLRCGSGGFGVWGLELFLVLGVVNYGGGGSSGVDLGGRHFISDRHFIRVGLGCCYPYRHFICVTWLLAAATPATPANPSSPDPSYALNGCLWGVWCLGALGGVCGCLSVDARRCSSLQLGIAAAFSPIAVICICYMAGLPLIEMSFLVPFCF